VVSAHYQHDQWWDRGRQKRGIGFIIRCRRRRRIAHRNRTGNHQAADKTDQGDTYNDLFIHGVTFAIHVIEVVRFCP
jgi:hypothetical protein